MLKGIAASSGIAIAKVYKLQQPVLNIEKKECDSATEVAKFQAALVKTQADIEAVKAKTFGGRTGDFRRSSNDGERSGTVRTDRGNDQE